MNETVFLGGCPVIRPEGIYLDGQRVISLGLRDVGLGDVGDLLAYRQEWEPFVEAHIKLWRRMNDLLESVPEAQKCPPGNFSLSQIQNLPAETRAFCASLALTRIRTSVSDSNGILPQWNAWKDKSSADILAGASAMLEWHQGVVMRVGGEYKDDLLKLADLWRIPVQLPDLPDFSTQQAIRARIEGAFITTKGVIQIVGYGVGQTLKLVSDTTQAISEGLSDTAKAIPKAVPWIGVAAAIALVVVGGALIYNMPRREAAPAPPPASRAS
jgi:hypothetical protein